MSYDTASRKPRRIWVQFRTRSNLSRSQALAFTLKFFFLKMTFSSSLFSGGRSRTGAPAPAPAAAA